MGGASTGSLSATSNTKPIDIGVVVGDPTKLAATFGMEAQNLDVFAGYRNLFAYLNKHGGLGGRQIRPVFHAIDAAAADQPSAFQAACTFVTQDHDVDAVFTFDINNTQGFSQCVGRKGIPQFDGGQYATDATDRRNTPNLFTPDALAIDRTAPLLVKAALARGWISKQDTLGVLTQDCPVDERVFNNHIVPTAKAAGIKLVRVAVSCVNGNAGIATAASQVAAAVLRFRSSGVTHVTLIGAPEGAGLLFFTQAASAQGFTPTYLITSNAFAYANSSGGLWAAGQLAKMKGIGWSPLLDVGPRAKPSARQAQAQQLCRTMDPSSAGAQGSTSPENLMTAAYAMCDTVRLLGAMLSATRGDASLSALNAAYPQAAMIVPSAKLSTGAFSSKGGRRDGVTHATPFSYKSACRCFTIDGAGIPTD